MTRLFRAAAGAIVSLAIAGPVGAQGKGKGHKSAPPSASALPGPTAAALSTAGVVPFAWIDDASVLNPGGWHHAG